MPDGIAGADVPAFCQVDGYVTTHVGFRLKLPAAWNGKFLHVGCGGLCGTDFEKFDRENTDTNAAPMSCKPALRKGYACLRSDLGHKGNDGKWAYGNIQGMIDYGFRATHVSTLAGKAIVETYYSAAPGKSYFFGCSGGGMQGLSEAQRFPWDFDGIVAGSAPVHGLTYRSVIADLWAYKISHDEAGKPTLTMADIMLLHRKVVDACDMNDGVKDGLIGDPRVCRFDPADLGCGKAAANACMSAEKIALIKLIYSGPTEPESLKGYAGVALGSELSWPETVISGSHFVDYATEAMRYMFLDPAPGPAWDVKDFDLARDMKRFGVAETLHAADNPDLRRYKAAGGKLIMFVGWADRNRASVDIDYYETVERVMGGRATTQDFARLFVVAGMDHCRGGDGPDMTDYLGALEAWVEKGKAPDMLLATRMTTAGKAGDFAYMLTDFPIAPALTTFTRPLYPYPLEAKYLGKGDPAKAESFGPVGP